MPITYKCPGCGAAMVFDSNSQKLKCERCGNEYDVSEIELNQAPDMQGEDEPEFEMYEDDAAWKVDEGSQEENEPETMNMKVYHCQSCGAELMSDEFSSAVMCSFCGNPSLVEDRLQGAYKPKYIIPFKIDREQAKSAYRSWVKKGPLTPSELATGATIEKISGLYVPFWIYNFNAESRMNIKATKVRTTRRGDTEYIYTDHYHVYRDVEADFVGIPTDASEKMDDEAMDKMEPYDYNELKPFSMPYLSGYLSERYNYTSAQMKERAAARVNRYITDITRQTVNGYSSVTIMNNQVRMNNTRTDYILMPVWMLNCKYKGKDFNFMLNGQTGKIVADRPISIAKTIAWGVGIFAATLLVTMIGGLWFV